MNISIKNNKSLGHTNNIKYNYSKPDNVQHSLAIECLGFIVNTYDALNYDIDLNINPEDLKNYKNVIVNDYIYKTVLTDGTLSSEKTAKCYRCRLRGIEKNTETYNRNILMKYTQCVKKIIDRMDGWVLCYISGVDIFNRILIDIYINGKKDSLDLCNYILNKSKENNNPFIVYPSYKNKSFSNKRLEIATSEELKQKKPLAH